MPDRPLRHGLPCPVLCVETGQTYPSIAAAAKACGCCPATFRKVLAAGEAGGGYHWQLQPQDQHSWSADHPWRRPTQPKRRRPCRK